MLFGRRVVPPILSHDAQLHRGLCLIVPITNRSGERQCLLQIARRPGLVERLGQVSHLAQRLATNAGRCVLVADGQRPLQPGQALSIVSSLIPEPAELVGQREQLAQPSGLIQPREGGSQVGVLGLQPVKGVGGANRAHSARRLAGKCQAPRRVAVSRRRLLAGRCQLLQPEFPNRLQHQVPRLVIRSVLLSQQALLHQRRHAVQDVDLEIVPAAGDCFRRLQRESADEDGESAEERLFLRRQQVVGPGDGVAHRLLASGQVASTPGQQRQPVVEPGQQRRRREDLDPGRGELDGQRQPIQPATDGGHCRCVLVGYREVGFDGLGSRDEEAHCGRCVETSADA